MHNRSKWKSLYYDQRLNEILNRKQLKIIERNSVVTSEFLNKKVKIYNGKLFVNVFIDEAKVGFKFGEFAYSRKRCIHKSKLKIKKKKK
jgi:small subunit ribosomal protein S19